MGLKDLFGFGTGSKTAAKSGSSAESGDALPAKIAGKAAGKPMPKEAGYPAASKPVGGDKPVPKDNGYPAAGKPGAGSDTSAGAATKGGPWGSKS